MLTRFERLLALCFSQIRQYFVDPSFYVADVTARGWCNDDGFRCEAFSPSSATVKARTISQMLPTLKAACRMFYSPPLVSCNTRCRLGHEASDPRACFVYVVEWEFRVIMGWFCVLFEANQLSRRQVTTQS